MKDPPQPARPLRQVVAEAASRLSAFALFSAVVLGVLVVDFVRNVGSVAVDLLEESRYPEEFAGAQPHTWDIGDRIVYYGPLVRSAVALVLGVALIAMAARRLRRRESG